MIFKSKNKTRKNLKTFFSLLKCKNYLKLPFRLYFPFAYPSLLLPLCALANACSSIKSPNNNGEESNIYTWLTQMEKFMQYSLKVSPPLFLVVFLLIYFFAHNCFRFSLFYFLNLLLIWIKNVESDFIKKKRVENFHFFYFCVLAKKI